MEVVIKVAYASCPPEQEEAWLDAARILLRWLEQAGNERRDPDGEITALEAAEQAKLVGSPAVRTAPASVNEQSIAPVDEVV